MATSRFEDLRSALATAITTRLATDGITGVAVHKYRPVTLQRVDVVWMGNIKGEQEPLTQAGGFRDETMEIDVAIRIPTFGDTTDEYATVEQRAEAVMASIEKAVRADITLTATVWNVEFDSYETNHTTDGDGAVGVVDIILIAEAHI